ncbi:MAP kinase kinase (MEK) [Phlyctochytrium bullatum]|nr:MAP kinase kinase (MEK) [Phlyctochytrium bullatum]
MSAVGTPKAKKKASLGLKLDSLPPSKEFDSPSQAKPLTTVDLSLPPQFSEIQSEDIEIISELGAGNGGTVNKVLHKPTNTIMARKVCVFWGGSVSGGLDGEEEFANHTPVQIIHVETRKTVQKQILRELQILKSCNSPYIVSFYGAFISDNNISICMEFMDLGSLDRVYKVLGTLDEDVIGKITVSVLKGLVYLYKQHKIIHRDVKPSNILLNSAGQVKMADFGVSGELQNSVVKSFVGTSAYMSPERIKGNKYSVRCDVWSLGISLMELAMGRFPFPADGKPLTLFELLECIVEEPLPSLPASRFSKTFEAFIAKCLIKDDAQRPKPEHLLSDPFCVQAEEDPLDMKKWAADFLKVSTEKSGDVSGAVAMMEKLRLEGGR